jgi:hypothetical protein
VAAAATLYPYTGADSRLYTQYLDVTGGGQRPLEAEPGQSYAIRPVAGLEDGLAVPPADGRWGPAPEAAPEAAPAGQPAARTAAGPAEAPAGPAAPALTGKQVGA